MCYVYVCIGITNTQTKLKYRRMDSNIPFHAATRWLRGCVICLMRIEQVYGVHLAGFVRM